MSDPFLPRRSDMNRGPMKTFASGIAGSLLFTTLAAPWAQANIWQERRQAAQDAREPIEMARAELPSLADLQKRVDLGLSAMPAGFSASLKQFSSRLPKSLASLPAAQGEIRGVSLSAQKNAPLVVLIQDAHKVPAA